MQKVVCHISFNHTPFDDRIYWKELLSLKQWGYLVTHIAVSDQEDDFLTEEGIRIILVKRKTKFKNPHLNKLLQLLFYKGTTAEDIYKKATALNADFYHYHDLQINAIAEKLKRLRQKPIVVYDSHEAYHLLLKQNETKWLNRLLNNMVARVISTWEIKMAKNCDLIITTDSYTNSYFEKNLPLTPKVILHNYSYFEPISTSRDEPKEYDFIYSGHISEARAIKELVYGLNHCKKNYPKVKLLIIGYYETDAFEHVLLNLIHNLGLETNITVEKSVPFNSMNKYYQKSRVGICLLYNTPKYTTAIPIKIFEYMSFGLPIICSEHGVTAEIIKENDCGIPVDHKDVAKIGNAMLELISNDNQYERLSLNGLKAVKEKYNWEHEKEKLLNVYRSLIKE